MAWILVAVGLTTREESEFFLVGKWAVTVSRD
jgi:hypothetical protein